MWSLQGNGTCSVSYSEQSCSCDGQAKYQAFTQQETSSTKVNFDLKFFHTLVTIPDWGWSQIIHATSNVLNINLKIVVFTFTWFTSRYNQRLFILFNFPHFHFSLMFLLLLSFDFSLIWDQECDTEHCEVVWSQCAECFPMCGQKSQDHFIMPAARLNEQKHCDWIQIDNVFF